MQLNNKYTVSFYHFGIRAAVLKCKAKTMQIKMNNSYGVFTLLPRGKTKETPDISVLMYSSLSHIYSESEH